MSSQSTHRHKLYKIEALRGLAAIYVVLHHSVPNKILFNGVNVGDLFRFGQEAVILFFLLSGFVIQYSFAKSSNQSFAHYFQKRALRIYVPLIAVFVLGFLSKSLNAGEWISIDFWSLIGNLFMLQDWAEAKPNVIVEPFLANGPLWSLAYEWWFYMLFFPLTVLIDSESLRSKWVYFIAIIAALFYVVYPLFVLRVFMYLAIWWAGAELAIRYMNGECRSLRELRLALLSLLAIVLILGFDVCLESAQASSKILLGHHPLLEMRHFIFTVVAIVCAFVWKSLNWWGFDTLIKPFTFFAPISYAIYISHYHLVVDATYFNFIPDPIVRWFAYFLVLLVASYFIEIKLYPWIRSYFSSRRMAS